MRLCIGVFAVKVCVGIACGLLKTLFYSLCEHLRMVKVKRMQLPGTDTIKTQILSSKWKNASDTKRIQIFTKRWPLNYLNRIQYTCNLHIHMSRVVRKPAFCICENKDADQLTAKLINAFVFATKIEQSLFFLNPNF